MSVDGITEREREFLGLLPASKDELTDALDIARTTLDGYRERLRDKGVDIQHRQEDGQYVWFVDGASGGSATDASAEGADDSTGDEDTDDSLDLSDISRRVVAALPASIPGLADTLGCDEAEAHSHLDRVRDDGVVVRYDADAGKFYLADERAEDIRSQAHLSDSAKTKRAKEIIREEEAVLDRRPPTDPLQIRGFESSPNKESLIAGIGDLHFGDKYRDDRGRVTYDRETAHRTADLFAQKVIHTSEQWTADHDECVLAILGDIATGTEIYETQHHEIEGLLTQQIKDGANALTRVVATLREHFDAVRVRAVVGNHGFQSASAARGSNTDLICYEWMRDALRREGYDDVDIQIASDTHHLNFRVRDWRVHIRHGQDSQKQVDETARSEADWRGWRDKHRFDLAFRGHYHVPSFHKVLNQYPVITTPSPAPGGEFADRIGAPDASNPAIREEDRDVGYCIGVSDERRVTDQRIIDGGGAL